MEIPGTWTELKKSEEGLQVRVGHDSLVGEVIRIEADKATVQVYEETGKPGTISSILEEER